MKIVKSLMIMALAVVLFSCEREDADALDVEAQKSAVVLNSDVDGDTMRGSGDDDEPEFDEFTETLPWVSFITGKVLKEYPSSRSEVNLKMDPNGVIKLDQLLTADGTLNGLSFNKNFKTVLEILLCQQVDCGKPEEELVTPPNGPFNGGGGGGFASGGSMVVSSELSPVVEEMADAFMDYIINQNCIELYFPKGQMIYFGDFEITSTSHPMNNSVKNDGYKRLYTPLITGENCEVEMVNLTYVTNNKNIIVARPYAMASPSASCIYTSYGVTDFTQFLDW
ncbi:MAG: hypothetical protein ABJM06_09975 [Gilvibacter sp.]